MQSFVGLIGTVLQLVIWAVIINAILSWLIAFGVVNMSNRFVYTVNDTLNRLTNPMLAPIRRFMPYLAGVDISPLGLGLLLIFAQSLLVEYLG